MWSITNLVDAIEAGLVQEACRVEREQAVYGLDALDELCLQPLLAQSLERAGYGVYREERYPAYRHYRNAGKGERCDLVLTPDARWLAAPEKARTLFDPPDMVPLAEAFWIEIKVVAQFKTAGPNRNYSSLFAAVRRDVAKLSRERGISYGALLILLFAQDQTVADHDLEVWRGQCVRRGLAVGTPAQRLVHVGDRLGNTLCRIGLYPIDHATTIDAAVPGTGRYEASGTRNSKLTDH